jgi:hypothetical protein
MICAECHDGLIFHWCFSCATKCESNPRTPELQKPGVTYLHRLGDNDCDRWTPRCPVCGHEGEVKP